MINWGNRASLASRRRTTGKLVVVSFLFAIAATAFAEPWTAVVDPLDGKYLYLNETGAFLPAGPFVQAESFSGGLGRTADEEATVYLKPDGKIVFSLPLPYGDTSAFSEGMAAFVREGLVGFINYQGREVLSPRFVRIPADPEGWAAPRFLGGRAVVGLPARHGWIKADGTLVEGDFPPEGFSQERGFRPIEGGFALIDVDGNRVGTDLFEKARGFSEGLSFVILVGKPSWVDLAGQIVATWAEGTEVGPLVGGYAVFTRGGWAGLVDKKGKEVVAADRYLELVPLHSGSEPSRVWRFRDKASGPWGLINERGTVLAKPQWDHVGPISEGLAIAVVGSRTGFLSPKGWLATPLTDYRLGPMKEGLAPVEKDGLSGFADARGKVVLDGRWRAVGSFASGLAPVQTDLGWGLIDKKGKPVGPQNYQHLGPLVSGRRVFTVDGKSGYLGEAGQPVLPAVYESARDFQGAFAWVVQDGVGMWIGVDGRPLGHEGFEPARSEGFVPPFAVVRSTRFGLVGPTGEYILPPVYEALIAGMGPVWALPQKGRAWECLDQGKTSFVLEGWVPEGPFSEGRALVSRTEADRREWALVDGGGALVPLGVQDVRGGLVGGRLCVRHSDGWGYVDASGRSLFGLRWDEARPFSEGFAAVAFDGQWGYIDAQGVKILPYQYNAAGEFQRGLAPVTIGESQAFITKTGQRVWP